GQALLVAGLFAIAETETLWVAAVLAAVVFAGNVMAVPAWNAAIMDLAPESHRGTIIGLSVALSGFGLAVGPALGGVIVSQSGAPAVFRTAAGLCALAGVAIALYAYRYRSRPASPRSEP
ncbi:MAG TPA: MFS transporter, partial [Tepidiformaceae bacterium]|nr:MFS transporter [Tepidiformaceae bacterium]